MANQLKLSSRTCQILENFCRIDKTMLFREGNEVRSSLPQAKDIFAIASIVEEIPQQFAIRDLNVFLSVLDLHQEPVLVFEDDKRVLVKSQKDTNRQFAMTLADHRVINALGKGKIPFPDEKNVHFSLTKEELQAVKRNVAVAKLPHVAFIGDGECIKIVGCDRNNPTSDTYTSILGHSDIRFRCYFSDRKIVVPLDENYDVTVGNNGENWIARWRSKDVDYYMSPEIQQQ